MFEYIFSASLFLTTYSKTFKCDELLITHGKDVNLTHVLRGVYNEHWSRDVDFDTIPRICSKRPLSRESYDYVAHGPLARYMYVKVWVAHAPGMPGTFSRHRLQRKPPVSDPGMHNGTCTTHVPWCLSGSLARGKRSRHSRRMREPQFYVSGKRPIEDCKDICRETTGFYELHRLYSGYCSMSIAARHSKLKMII